MTFNFVSAQIETLTIQNLNPTWQNSLNTPKSRRLEVKFECLFVQVFNS